MSPELEKLLEAYDAKRTCPPEEKLQRLATFERLLADALSGGQARPMDSVAAGCPGA